MRWSKPCTFKTPVFIDLVDAAKETKIDDSTGANPLLHKQIMLREAQINLQHSKYEEDIEVSLRHVGFIREGLQSKYFNLKGTLF